MLGFCRDSRAGAMAVNRGYFPIFAPATNLRAPRRQKFYMKGKLTILLYSGHITTHDLVTVIRVSQQIAYQARIDAVKDQNKRNVPARHSTPVISA
jgi:hypothetical protein